MSIISHTPRYLLAQRCLLLNQKRFNMRESIHRYVEPNKFKKHMLAASEPYIKRKFLLPEESCKGLGNMDRNLHPLERILVDELLDEIKRTNFILFLQYNYTQFQSDRVYKNTITKLGGTFHALNNNIYKEAFRILNREEVSNFFIARNALITGHADKLPGCVKALKKMPQFLLLAGYIDKHLYDIDQLKQISATTNIDQCRANLLNMLNTPAVNLSSYLQQHNETIKPLENDQI